MNKMNSTEGKHCSACKDDIEIMKQANKTEGRNYNIPKSCTECYLEAIALNETANYIDFI